MNVYPRDPGSPSENSFMEPKYLAFRRWLYTPIILWQGDWIPRDRDHFFENHNSRGGGGGGGGPGCFTNDSSWHEDNLRGWKGMNKHGVARLPFAEPRFHDKHLTHQKYLHTHRIHVWYIYLHLVDIYGKCRQIYHTWIGWDIEENWMHI